MSQHSFYKNAQKIKYENLLYEKNINNCDLNICFNYLKYLSNHQYCTILVI